MVLVKLMSHHSTSQVNSDHLVLHINCISNSIVQLATSNFQLPTSLSISSRQIAKLLEAEERTDSSLSTNVDVNSLDLGVVLNSVFTEFSTDTRLLETTEWNVRV
jgi:hypothetical protein